MRPEKTAIDLLEQVRWSKVHEEALEYLRGLLRINTVNPPGNESAAADYVAQALSREGIEVERLEAAPGRSNLIARLSGRLGGKDALMLSSHLDVVAVEPDAWRHDPFGAVVAEGCIWGRGAFDMKSKTAFDLMALLLTRRLGIDLTHDLMMCAVADEETGSRLGSAWLVENHPDLVRARYVFNEAGGFSMEALGKKFFPVQVAEKGLCWLRLTMRGDPGHGSVPQPDSAPVKLARVVTRLAETPLPLHMTPEAQAFLQELSRGLEDGGGTSLFPAGSDMESLAPQLEQIPVLGKVLLPMFHNTLSPNIIRAGSKINVIPGHASVELDGRLLPGQSSDDLIAEIRAVVGDEPEIEVLLTTEGVTMPTETRMFELIKQALTRNHPAGVVLPWLMPGFTDSRNWSRLGASCYGFHPVSLPAGTSVNSLAHGHNERITIDGFFTGLETYLSAVWSYCLSGPPAS